MIDRFKTNGYKNTESIKIQEVYKYSEWIVGYMKLRNIILILNIVVS
jgi:hypothetical protein